MNTIQNANFVFYNVFLLIETLFLLYFFTIILRKKAVRVAALISGGLFTFIWFLFFIDIGTRKYMETCGNLENLYVLAFATTYYIDQFTRIGTGTAHTYTHPIFLAVSAYLVYTAGTFFLFLFIGTLTPAEQEDYYNLNYVFTIIRNGILTVSMFMKNNNVPRKKFQLT